MAGTDYKPKSATTTSGIAKFLDPKFWYDLRAYISRRTSELQDVEDLTQRVCEAIVRGSAGDEVISKPFGYAAKVADREMAKYAIQRSLERERFVSADEVDLDVAANNAESGGFGDEQSMDQETESALSKLSPKLAAVLVLIVRDRLTYAEAAKRLNVTEHAVKKNFQRARKQLKRHLSSDEVKSNG